MLTNDDVVTEQGWLEVLEADGLLQRTPSGAVLTHRWHAAMARASQDLYRRGDALVDLRIPVARVVVDLYVDQPAPSLAVAIGALLPIVIADLETVVAPPSS